MEQSQQAKPAPEDIVAMIPRINIHAFCEDQNTANVMQAAASDRRMSHAHMQVQLGGIPAAIQAYSNARTPEVLLVESTKQRDALLSDLGHLAHVCDPSTKVVILGHVNDIILYRELMRQGVSEYIVVPIHQLQIIDSIAGMFSDPDAPPLGKIMSFVGAKGGVGSSTIAHNVAWLFSKHYASDTIITDLDLSFGTAGLNFNTDGSQGIWDAVSNADRVDKAIIDRLISKCTDRLSLFSAPASIDREALIDTDAIENILGIVRSNVPCVVVDVPNIWSAWTKQVLSQSDEIIITATPELASLRNAKNLFDFAKETRPNDNPPRLVMNQVGVPKRPEIPVADFAKAIGVEPTIVIPFDGPTFGAANSNGQMIGEVDAKSEAFEMLSNLAQLLQGQEPPPKESKLKLGSLKEKLASLRKK
jgi:pilus assembly protein CpaE